MTGRRLLITRSRPAADDLAARLAARGVVPLVVPMLEIRPLAAALPPLAGYQGLVVTSAHGLRALAAAPGMIERRDIPVYTVGDATAEAARAAGFSHVYSARGDVTDLAALLRRRADPTAGPLLHGAGTHLAGDLARAVGEAGITLDRVVLYEAVPAATLDPALADALAGGQLNGALFFSPRGAARFADLVTAAGLASACAGVAAYALSPAVAAALSPLDWARLAVAPQPDEGALLALLETA